MALSLKISSSANINKIKFYDVTDLYENSINLTGWGNPNIEYSDVTKATIKVTNLFNNIVFSFNVANQLQQETPKKSIKFGPFTNEIGDGVWKIEYKVKTNEEQYEVCTSVFYMCELDCCIDKLIVSALDSNLENNIQYQKNLLELSSKRQSLKIAALMRDLEKVKQYYNNLKNLCEICACAI